MDLSRPPADALAAASSMLRPEDPVLVVDDSVVQRDHAVGLLRELGVNLLYEAADGREALALLDLLVLPPALVLLDLEMPGMDGIELLQQLAQRGFDGPLIVNSSREDSLIASVEAMAQALGLQVLAGLRKPLTRPALEAALAGAALRGAPGAAPAAPKPVIGIEQLRRAIADGLVQPHFQPKVDVRTGLLRGVEALARWTDPVAGRLPPDSFIPLAEASGLIHPLTMSMLGQAAEQAARWASRGLKLSLAVNLSPLLLDHPGLAAEIAAVAAAHRLPPSQITLEITESSVATQHGSALATLAKLRLQGFGLAIDDYGTGFSSMQRLARVPFSELKVDRSFVHGAHQRRHLRVILQSALHMAQQLELVTVAEGVETMEDWRLLQQFGCGIAQGWLIGKPMPGSELPAWIRAHQQRLPELRATAAGA